MQDSDSRENVGNSYASTVSGGGKPQPSSSGAKVRDYIVMHYYDKVILLAFIVGISYQSRSSKVRCCFITHGWLQTG